MTVAEEIGHVILHDSIIQQVEQPEDFIELQRHEKWHYMERNAKKFAAYLLMPAQRLLVSARALYPKLVAVAGFNNPDAIVNTLAARLASDSYFRVSTQTMKFRFTEYPEKIESVVRKAIEDKQRYN
jgi:Zn-dependent peptidase ImmA (M78 family)